jgi:ferrous iron transport protein A
VTRSWWEVPALQPLAAEKYKRQRHFGGLSFYQWYLLKLAGRSLRIHGRIVEIYSHLQQSAPFYPRASPHAMTPITALGRGEVAEVVQLIGAPEHVRRLEELGLRDGARLEILRSGSPCIVRVAGTTLCFRDDDLLRVLVTPRKTA